MRFPPFPIYVIDFEGSPSYGIVEYGIVTLRDGNMERLETGLCRADAVISWRDRRQHGLGNEDVSDAPAFTVHWDRFAGMREQGLFASHNAFVENNLLKRYWPYPRLSFDPKAEGGKTADWGPWIDTLALYRKIYPDLSSYKLSDLVNTFQLSGCLDEWAETHCPENRSKWHCAPYDATASALLLQRLQAVDLPDLLSLI